MVELDVVAEALGILIDPEAPAGFAHVGTAWSVGGGGWITAWQQEDPPPASLRLLTAVAGEIHPISGWEQDGAVMGFTSVAVGHSLSLTPATTLRKRQPLAALGYPSVIDHPAFNLAHGSLAPERYHPYCCPWLIPGHLALFGAEDGYLTGRSYPGMAGCPVFDEDSQVVGLVVDAEKPPGQPPLTRFVRLSTT